ncbi:MAG: hypothetical protein MUP49_05640 [Dehalococcoidia bacterium]|nr:hypothetical protein [Dehalococcoidia bacterium]
MSRTKKVTISELFDARMDEIRERQRQVRTMSQQGIVPNEQTNLLERLRQVKQKRTI